MIKTRRNEQVTVEQLESAGPVDRFYALNEGPLPDGKLHMRRPLDDKEIPWSALVLGLWIPNFFYWGLNQYITQRTLGSKSLAEGQKGIVFAAFLKLIIPFVVVIPGILAYNLYQGDLRGAAINKNAKTMATYAPDLYESLSSVLQPDPDDPRNVNELKSIAYREELAREQDGSQAFLFKFTVTLAEDHTDDVRKIVAHNASATGQDVPADSLSAIELFAFNEKLLDAAEKDDDGDSSVKTLVLRDFDAAFPILLKNLLPKGNGLQGFVLAAIFGAVVSSLASMLNSASTIATMDLYAKIRGGKASQIELVTLGRVFVVLFVLIAILIAPALDDPAFDGIFTFIQEFQGFISPGVLAIFLFGLLVHKAPRACGTVGLILSPLLYGLFKFSPKIPVLKNIPILAVGEKTVDNVTVVTKGIADWSFLDRMSLTFLIVLAVLTVMTLIHPLKKPVDLPVNEKMDVTSSPGAKAFAVIVVLVAIGLYVKFW